MKRATIETIWRIWDEIEEAEPDISTERLLTMTAQRASIEVGGDLDESHVAEAMSKHKNAKPVGRK